MRRDLGAAARRGRLPVRRPCRCGGAFRGLIDVEAAGNPAAANRGDLMSAMDRWIMTVCADLGLDPGAADARAILDMTRDVAHNVDRPAAPVTAYLIGVAVGRGMPLKSAIRRVQGLAAAWPGHTEDG